MQILPYWLQNINHVPWWHFNTNVLIYNIPVTSNLQSTLHFMLRVCIVHYQKNVVLQWQASGLQCRPRVMGLSSQSPILLSFLPSILSILMRVVSVLSYPHLPLMLHSSPFSASLPSPLSMRPLSNPPRTATRHPASHKSSLKPSQRTTAASCNSAKSECNHTERTEPLRQLAQPRK